MVLPSGGKPGRPVLAMDPHTGYTGLAGRLFIAAGLLGGRKAAQGHGQHGWGQGQ
jgi:hypothetical protein